MSAKRNQGFTLVEMLVVIAIIGTLASMILPAVQQARENARRTSCVNNLTQIHKAMMAYLGAHKQQYPGWRNRIGKGVYGTSAAERASGRPASWVVALLPYLDSKSLYDDWKRNPNPETFFIESLFCPSAVAVKDDTGPALSYVVNGGFGNVNATDTNTAGLLRERAANGIFHDRFFDANRRTRDADIKDGENYTLLLSENLQAGNWSDGSAESHKHLLTFVWHDSPNNTRQINGDKLTTTKNMDTARPSAYHYGGVNVVFASGRTLLIQENIDYEVYKKLMTPDCQNSDHVPASCTVSDEEIR